MVYSDSLTQSSTYSVYRVIW